LYALKELTQAAGVIHPQQIDAYHIVRRGTDHKVKSLAQLIMTQLPNGALLEGDVSQLPLIFQNNWPRAQAESFMPLSMSANS
jgi:hypothetical protein